MKGGAYAAPPGSARRGRTSPLDILRAMRNGLPKKLRLGTSSWSSKDWVGVLYPEKMQPRDFIAEYAKRYTVVEIDSTFYGIPRLTTVQGWASKTPPHFRFAAKVPQEITHEAQLEHCTDTFVQFVECMGALGTKLGPLLLQFPYYKKAARPPLDDFVGRLDAFLAATPRDLKMAVEVRNRTWLKPELLDCLRKHGAAFTFISHPWMPEPEWYTDVKKFVTADFVYARWLGDRYGIERITKTWNKTVVDKTADLDAWIRVLRDLLGTKSVEEVWGFVNNHYAGHAPDSIRLLTERWMR